MLTHTVKQGEHLVGIAAAHGFPDFKKIWDDGANADLKKKRENPNVLLPGDVVVIPDKEPKQFPRGTEEHHTFRVKGKPLMLRIVLHNESAEPLGGAECTLDVEGQSAPVKVGGDGKLERPILREARRAALLVRHEQLPADLFADVGIGELDPADTVTGQIGRLNNMGYDAGLVGEPLQHKANQQFRSAVEEFQCNNGLTVDGVCGPATQAKLKKVHGC